MAIVYSKLTLGELILQLRELPAGSKVKGFEPLIFSYRSYYDRAAVEPNDANVSGSVDLADSLQKQVGKLMEGWKGGDFNVSADKGIYLASWGDTGPCFAGLFEESPGVYVPVVVHEGSVW